jgi:2-haloacid dehalogenase
MAVGAGAKKVAMNHKIKALVFDAYGTLFDVHSVVARLEELFPGRGQEVSRIWRTKQLEYTWLLSLMGGYEDFWEVTARSLAFACRALHLDCPPARQAHLLDAYLRLEAFPEVPRALMGLTAYPLAILSNGSPRMLDGVVENAGLKGTFTQVLSVDAVKIYKPSPRVYALASQRLGLEAGAIGFVSANSWDIHGAGAFGFRTVWLNRTDQPGDELGFPPDITVQSLTDLAKLLSRPNLNPSP